VESTYDQASALIDAVLRTSPQLPPKPVLAAVLALLDGAVPDPLVVRYESPSDQPGTSWEIVALVKGAVVTVAASSPTADWTWDGDPQSPVGSLIARMRPVREVAYLEVDQITDFNDDIRASPEVDRDPDFDYTAFSGWEYQPRWVLAFRDGTRVAIQATLRTSTARKECDAIAKSIRSALVVTGA